jgi:hypothetical protein
MADKLSADPIKDPKYIRDTIANEITHRSDRRQQIFSWASSLLVAIIGGVIALTFTNQHLLASLNPKINQAARWSETRS